MILQPKILHFVHASPVSAANTFLVSFESVCCLVWSWVFAGEMFLPWIKDPNFEVPIKHFQGKTCKFLTLSSVLALVSFLCRAWCDELPMVSVPLGFEISGYDRTRTWVSQNGVFSFGFFESYQKDDGVGFLVGVRYNIGEEGANVPVWTVGGGVRVSINSTIRLSTDGRLVLIENSIGLVVWSTDTSSLGVKTATLLNNGNLVLVGVGKHVVWKSFDSPTTTLLPEQSLHFPQTLRAPSTRSTSSYYSFVIRQSGGLALVWESNVTYWRTHLSFSVGIIEARFDVNGLLRLIDGTNRSVWSVSSKDFEDSSVMFRHLRMDSDGNLRIYSWDDVLHRWRVGWQAVENQCDVFGSCGLYSFCGYNSTGPICDCIYQDSGNGRVDSTAVDAGSFGCKKMVDLNNCKMKTSMMVMKGMVFYGLYPPQDVHMMLNEQNCKEYCSNDSTCIAATSKNDGTGICTIKRTTFISGYRKPSIPATSFLKVCLVPQAVSAQGADHHIGAKPILRTKSFLNNRGQYWKFVGAIALIVVVAASGFLTIEVVVVWYVYHRQQIRAQRRTSFGKDAQMNAHYSFLFRLSFEEIKEVTANFTDQLGPSVYKGVLPNGTTIVAKTMNNATANEKDFRFVVATLGGMQHRNLVILKGFCFEANHRFLVYEYVQNGSLEKWLLDLEHDQTSEQNWQRRLDISLGVTRALAYLHSECQICVAHGNLKLENVLLDENFVPKLTDYGLRSLLQKEAASSSESHPQRDIYMLGEMLLQVMTCKRNIQSQDLHCLIDNMIGKLNSEGAVDSEGIERVMRIAFWCMHNQPCLRPSIGEVVKVLEGTLSVDRPHLAAVSSQDQMLTRIN